MADVKVAVIYCSATGSVYALAQQAAEAAEKAGAEVREGWSKHSLETESVQEATPEDIEWADVVVFGTPTRFGNVSAQLKQYLDTLGGLWSQGKLANKVYTAFTSAGTAHGGHETTLLALYNSIHHFGGIVVSPGYTDPVKFQDGNPYGASHASANGANPPGELDLQAISYSVKRATEIGAQLKRGAAE